MATTPTRLSVLSFGSAPPPAVAQLPANVSLNLVDAQQQPGAVKGDTATAPIDLAHVARTVLKAKRVAVVCGAGISTASGIPDFRSGAGLFESLKKQYPDAKLSSGKDLFDVGLFASETNAAIFFNMIAELKKQTDAVEPTAFHSWLKHLDDDGKLFRVYTQNIDALEEKAGLTYGLGDKSLPLPPRRKGTAAPPPRSPSKSSTTTTTRTSTPLPPPPPPPSSSSVPLEPTSSQASIASSSCTVDDTPPPPPATHSAIPRVIPLHGHLSTLSCSACKHEVPLSGAYVDLLSTGSAPLCPACLSIDQARSAAGERSRGVGMMRPDVVLYGEEHKDGDRVGEITQRDLMGQRPDLLIVVGTTLKVKGTKRLVRELAKVIRPPPQQASSSAGQDEDSSSTATTSPSKPQRKRRAPPPRPPPIHTLYLNYDFPTPSKEWAGVFDCWLRGDIQEFVEAVQREEEVLKREQEGKERKRGEKQKRKREQEQEQEQEQGADGERISNKRVAPNGKGKGKGKVTTVRKPLVPARNANPPSPLRPPPPPPPAVASKPAPAPPPPARTDPNGRTRSSLHHYQPPSVLGGGPFAPVAAEQHYRQPYQLPAALALASAASSSPFAATPFMLPGAAGAAATSSSSFAPFSQRRFGGDGANHSQAASSSSSSSMGGSFPPAPSQSVLWNHHNPLPALPTPGYDPAPSVSSSGTAPFSTVSTTEQEQDRHQRDQEMISNMATTTTLRRQVSSSSLSSLSDEEEVDDTEEEEEMEDDEEVEITIKVGNKKQRQRKKETAPAPPTRERRSKEPRPPLAPPPPPQPQPRRGSGMSTRSSTAASVSGSDSSKGLAQLSVAVAAAPSSSSSSSSSASRSSSSSPLPPPPSALPRRRSPRSSTSTSLEQQQQLQQHDAAKHSHSTVVGAKNPGRRPRTRSSVSPPTNKATTGKASKKVATMTHEQQLEFKVTKATVAKVTGTARKRK